MENLEELESVNILSLPVEILVYIASFLPTARDKVKLRYVSRTLRVVSETPSLWSEFVWPLYDRREERSVMNVLKACGDYIRRLVFPDHVTPSKLMRILSHCNNVTQLCLPSETKLDSEQLKTAVQRMNHLEKLEVRLTFGIKSLLQINGLKELTVHLPAYCFMLCHAVAREWVLHGFNPCSFNIVIELFYNQLGRSFMRSWSQWNSSLPVGSKAYFKLYQKYRMPLNLFPILPAIQLEFGERAALPFVKPSSFGLLGLERDLLILTNSAAACKAEIASPSISLIFNDNMVNRAIGTLNFVTEFDFSSSETLYSGHLEQVAIACPNLQRLNLQNNYECLSCLRGLRTIGECCQGLCGLNLFCIPAEEVESLVQLWEILSNIKKLSHLAVESCVFQDFVENDSESIRYLISLFQKCSSLQALESQGDIACSMCSSDAVIKWSFLCHFPLLRYCRLCTADPNGIQYIVNGCKELVCLSCSSQYDLFLSSVCTSSLQQLYIESEDGKLAGIFMETVSAHGGLVYVILSVNSVSAEGITSLITNSPGLLTLSIITYEYICNENGLKINLKDFKSGLKRKFPCRKLFTVGNYKLVHNNRSGECCLSDFLSGTDLLPLWLN